jgi:A/G-specific adenine glycosylase
MDLFPTVQALAEAPEEPVIKAWEGLGYYSRARALHAAAKILVERHGGTVPRGEPELRALPGIGPYTAGAIRAFAFHERAAAVDANVRRVITRLVGHDNPKEIEAVVDRLLPMRRPWVAMEALIELGALVCKPRPTCEACPLSDRCYAYVSQTQDRIEKRSSVRTKLWRDVVVLVHEDRLFITIRKGREVMSGLYEFPYYETVPGGRSLDDLVAYVQPMVPTPLCPLRALSPTTHTFTRFHVTLYPVVVRCHKRPEWIAGQWVTLHEALSLPLSSGHRRVLYALRDSSATFAYL